VLSKRGSVTVRSVGDRLVGNWEILRTDPVKYIRHFGFEGAMLSSPPRISDNKRIR